MLSAEWQRQARLEAEDDFHRWLAAELNGADVGADVDVRFCDTFPNNPGIIGNGRWLLGHLAPNGRRSLIRFHKVGESEFRVVPLADVVLAVRAEAQRRAELDETEGCGHA